VYQRTVSPSSTHATPSMITVQSVGNPFGQDISPFQVTADYTGDYYLQVRSADTGGTGTYQIDVDTFVSVDYVKSDNVNADGTVSVGGSVTGNIDFSTDQDWFKVSFVAGQTYTIRLDTEEFEDQLADGTVEVMLPGGFGTGAFALDDAQFNYTASQSGEFFIRVSDNFSDGDTGMYRLTVTLAGQSSSSVSAAAQPPSRPVERRERFLCARTRYTRVLYGRRSHRPGRP
jgi:hypothetical protein